MQRPGTAWRRRGEALHEVWGHGDLRRLTLAWGAFFLFDWTTLVGLSVWAFDRGGAAAVGIVGVCRMLPAAVALPFGAWAADRFPRHRVVAAVLLVQSVVLVALMATVVADLSLIVYVLTAASGVVATPFRPATLALLPLVARSPRELIAANVTAGLLEGVATLVGPALAGLLLLGGDPALVLGVALGATVGGLVAVWGVQPVSDPSAANRHARESPVAAMFGGVRILRHEWPLALIVGCFVAQLFVRGMLTVLLVVVSFDLLALGESGVGWLGAAMGVGGTLGAGVALGLTGRRRLGRPMAMGLILWGFPIAAIGLIPMPVVALAALGLVGIGNSVLDASGFTLLQRLADDRTLGRVFGVLFTVGTALGAAGAIIAPALVRSLGLETSLVIVGLLLPVIAVAASPGLRRIDANSEPPSEQLEVIAELVLFAGLPPTTLEKLAARSTIVSVKADTVIVEEGDVAQLFYIVVDGEVVVVTQDGALIRTIHPGGYFGEIGLIRRVPRTASVRATAPTRLVALGGPAFVDAITGHAGAFATTHQLIDDRLNSPIVDT